MRGGLIGRRHQHDFVALGCTGLLYGELDELATRPEPCASAATKTWVISAVLGASGLSEVSFRRKRLASMRTTPRAYRRTPGHQKVARQLRMGRGRAMMRTPSAPP